MTERYLVVFEGECSRRVPVPDVGQVSIGRAEACEVRLSDASVSRTHAVLDADTHGVRLSDLGSRGGTLINGVGAMQAQGLASGDVLTIGSVAMVLHAPPQRFPTAPMQDAASFRRRLDEELERALRYKRPLSLCTLLFETPPDRAHIAANLGLSFRRMDCAAWLSQTELVVALPESDEAGAGELAMRLNGAFSSEKCRAGLAFCPRDGLDRDILIAAARAAARATELHGVGEALESFKRLVVGEQMVLVADPAMVCLFDVAERLAATDKAVLICGEGGTGKKLAASALHQWSNRMLERLVAIDCAALDGARVEAELFGDDRRGGVFEQAAGGTVLLEDIENLPFNVQERLGHLLEHRRVLRVSESRERAVDVRLVASSAIDLEEQVKLGRFRKDLWDRLSASLLWFPPLRDRPRDLALLAHTFLQEQGQRSGRRHAFASEAYRRLHEHRWPGNVAELREVIAAVSLAVRGEVIEAAHVDAALSVR